MQKTLLALLLGLTLALCNGTLPAQAQSGDVTRLVQRVNELRASLGLPPYQIDNALMLAAQMHTEWEVSAATMSHTGAGGTTPRDRAFSAGYGGGSTVWIHENIYWGSSGTPDTAFNWWLNSPIHYQGMSSPDYTHIGVGVAYNAEGGGYFTLMFGWISGQPAPQSSQTNYTGASGPLLIIEPIEVASPRDDGSLVHVVEEGQAIWSIAAAYDTSVSEVLALNRLSQDAIIRPGDELIIVPVPIASDAAEAGPIYHTVETGQTLWQIALAYDLELPALLEMNALAASTFIQPGDELLVVAGPDGEGSLAREALYHTVTSGQTLSQIALIYAVDFDSLLELNNLTKDTLIRPGDRLLVRPGVEPVVSEATESDAEDTVQSSIPEEILVPLDGAPQVPTSGEALANSDDRMPVEREARGFLVRRILLIGGMVIVAALGIALMAAGWLLPKEGDL